MGSQRLDFRPATCDIYARPGSDLTFTVAVSGTGYTSAPTVACDIGGQTPTTAVTLTAGVVLVTVTLSNTQTTALGATGSSWSMLFTSGTITTPILTGSYVGGTSGNTSQGMQVGVAVSTGSVSVQVLTAGGGGSGGGGGSMTAADILAALLTVDGGGSGLDADLLDGQSSAAFATASALTAHEADTTSVHGIADTGALVTTSSAPELIRDTIGAALVEGAGIDITVNDAGDAITIAATGGRTVVSRSTTHTAANGEIVLADALAAGWVLTLPAPTADHEVNIKKVDVTSNAVVITPSSGLIDGSASVPIDTPFESVTVVADGTNWWRI
jgi:hypothetical protein